MRTFRHSDRRGTVVVLTALLLTALFAMVAFAIDLGYIVHARTELQRAADACALAAAGILPDHHEAIRAARETALDNYESVGSGLEIGDIYDAGGSLDPFEIQFGYWNRNDATFSCPPPYGRRVNAARVTLRRSEATGNPVRLFFGRVLGTSQVDVLASATAMYDCQLCGPFVGIDWLSVPGSPSTDSYDSDESPYSWSTATDRGSICSDGPIDIEGAAVIGGDARAGKDYDVTLYGGAEVTGSIGTRLKPLNLPVADATVAATVNDNDQIPLLPEGQGWKSPLDADGNFLLDGSKILGLPPGTYYFNDFTVTGQSVLNIYGPTVIYVTGNMERSGGTMVNNYTQDPSDLKFYMTGGTALITSNNDFYGVVYAPNTDITVDGDSDFYGAIVGKTLTITGSGSGHYDESLDLSEVDLPTRTALVD